MSLHDDLLTLGVRKEDEYYKRGDQLSFSVHPDDLSVPGPYQDALSETLQDISKIPQEDIPRWLTLNDERHNMYYSHLEMDTIWKSDITDLFDEYLVARLNGVIP